jgi:hypothetical protein
MFPTGVAATGAAGVAVGAKTSVVTSTGVAAVGAVGAVVVVSAQNYGEFDPIFVLLPVTDITYLQPTTDLTYLQPVTDITYLQPVTDIAVKLAA